MSKYVKFPRTLHSPISKSITSDDKCHKTLDYFDGMNGVLSEKMDGENWNGYSDYSHARSIDSNNHPSRNWIKGYWAERQYLVPDGWRFCFENCYAQHSIRYENLDTYAYLLNIWNEKNECLSYSDTLDWCQLLDLTHVPVIYVGKFNEKLITNIFESMDFNKQEGVVFRNADTFHYDDYSKNVFKAVRPNHVQTDEHWMNQQIVPNKLKSNSGKS